MIRLIFITTVIVAALAGTVHSQPAGVSPDRTTGIVRGSVVVAPSCPGPARGDGADCTAQPIQIHVSIYAASADATSSSAIPLATVATDRHGQFRVDLAPGSYRLVPKPSNGIAVGKPTYVNVAAGSTVDVQLLFDSGKR
jgi:hypothetical protein